MTPETIDLIGKIGVLGFIGVVCAYVFLSLIRSNARRSNAETAAQETIRRLYEKLTEDVKQLRTDLDTANDKIDELEGLIELSKKTNESLTTERDQLRRDLTTTNQKLTNAESELGTLREQVAEMRGQLTATERLQIGVVDKIVKFMEDMATAQKPANGSEEAVKTETIPTAEVPHTPDPAPAEDGNIPPTEGEEQ